MDAVSWSARLSSASKRYQLALQSRSDMFMGFEEIDGDDDIREEFPCPFCSECFDIVGLCCHIDDEHPVEAKNGVSYMQRKRKSRKVGSHSTLSLLRRELREGNLQSLFGGSSCIVSSTNAAPDPLLSSFILPMVDDFGSVQSHPSAESISVKKRTNENVSESTISFKLGLPILLHYLSRIRRRRQVDLSLFKDCCCPPCLTTTYEEEGLYAGYYRGLSTSKYMQPRGELHESLYYLFVEVYVKCIKQVR
ncbi:unnamed protein product [Camellia sinensis]